MKKIGIVEVDVTMNDYCPDYKNGYYMGYNAAVEKINQRKKEKKAAKKEKLSFNAKLDDSIDALRQVANLAIDTRIKLIERRLNENTNDLNRVNIGIDKLEKDTIKTGDTVIIADRVIGGSKTAKSITRVKG